MRFLGNVLWFFTGGLILGISWCIAGLLWCITIVGIPWGVQCFKFAKLMFAPFGKEIQWGLGPLSLLANIAFIVITGVPLAIESAIIGVVFCITIVGIPWGLQCFKFAKLALMPFGARVRRA